MTERPVDFVQRPDPARDHLTRVEKTPTDG